MITQRFIKLLLVLLLLLLFKTYTGCLKIASTKKTVASGSPKKSKKPIFNFLKQKG
jgi:hypothetical protein